jgi:hypothetical protein
MNTFTGSSGIGIQDAASAGVGAIIVGVNNTFTSLQTALDVTQPNTILANFSGNTITKSTTTLASPYTGAIQIGAGSSITITGNQIIDNAGYSMKITALPAIAPGPPPAATGYAITGNTFSNNVKGFYITAAVGTGPGFPNNYWGGAGGMGATGSDVVATGSSITAMDGAFKPFLGSPAVKGAIMPGFTNVVTPTKATTAPDSYPMDPGISFNSWTAPDTKYLALTNLGTTNPVAVPPPADAINYYDVYTNYITGSDANMQINFYATGIDSTTNAYFYNAGTGKWVYCSQQGTAGTGGYVYIQLTTTSTPALSDLYGTYFVLVKGVAAAPAAITIQSPSAANGLTTGLTNVLFSWNAVNTATTYKIVVSAKADYSNPVVTETVNGTAYVLAGPLTTGAYYFQVTALQGATQIAAGSGVFNAAPSTTAAPPTTVTTTVTPPAPPAVTTTVTNQPTTTTLTFTQESGVTPAWIWGIIAIGAILIIVVIVLIVRTRRTV